MRERGSHGSIITVMDPFDEPPADPLPLFDTWFEQADSELPEAAALATADGHGRPSVRMVLARHTDGAFRFFTNHRSRKGAELEANPHGALAFWWDDRQVTVTGPVRRLPDADSDAYWATRPRPSQLSASVSPQSQPVPARAALEEAAAELDAAYRSRPVPRPDHWGGYALVPDELVFWAQRDDRLHDRVRYTRTPDGWAIERLAP
jgi:pyridoxamine 5'-phosphate oxidase